MTLSVNLDEIIDEMELQSDMFSAYLDRTTGKVVRLSDENFSAAEEEEDLSDYPDWEVESILLARDVLINDEKYVLLPSQYDIHEYEIIEDFCFSLKDDGLRDKLSSAIKGRGAFRRFRDMIYDCGIESDWFAFRREAFRSIGEEWCESNDIPYTGGSADIASDQGVSKQFRAEDFIGTWKLLSFEMQFSGGETLFPFGESVKGLLNYTAGGYMSGQLMPSERPAFSSEEPMQGTPEEMGEAFKGFVGYYGRYDVNPETNTVTHSVEGSLFPNWEGGVQERSFEISDNYLTLKTPPMTIGNETATGVLLWERVE